MKNLLFSFIALFVMAVVMVSCQKENLNIPTDDTTAFIDKDFNGPSAIVAPPVPPVGLDVPDLSVSVTTNIARFTNSCGPNLPNVSCSAGGQRVFIAYATVTNNGTGPLPPGTLEIQWTDITNRRVSIPIGIYTHTGIQPNQSIVLPRGYYMGPCAGVPSFFQHIFFATVDPNNLILEINETNNVSNQYLACNDT